MPGTHLTLSCCRLVLDHSHLAACTLPYYGKCPNALMTLDLLAGAPKLAAACLVLHAL